MGCVAAKAIVGAERIAISDDENLGRRKRQCSASAPKGAFKMRVTARLKPRPFKTNSKHTASNSLKGDVFRPEVRLAGQLTGLAEPFPRQHEWNNLGTDHRHG